MWCSVLNRAYRLHKLLPGALWAFSRASPGSNILPGTGLPVAIGLPCMEGVQRSTQPSDSLANRALSQMHTQSCKIPYESLLCLCATQNPLWGCSQVSPKKFLCKIPTCGRWHSLAALITVVVATDSPGTQPCMAAE